MAQRDADAAERVEALSVSPLACQCSNVMHDVYVLMIVIDFFHFLKSQRCWLTSPKDDMLLILLLLLLLLLVVTFRYESLASRCVTLRHAV